MSAVLKVSGLDFLVDDWVMIEASKYNWQVPRRETPYALGYLPGVQERTSLHRLAIGKDIPEGFVVDHINGDFLDCREQNLRLATRRQNRQNSKVQKNRTGLKGVHPEHRRFVAMIRVDGKLKRVGCFDSPISAAIAYDNAAREYFGEFARVNFPQVHVDTPKEPPKTATGSKNIIRSGNKKGWKVQITDLSFPKIKRYQSKSFYTLEQAEDHRDRFIAAVKELGPFEQDTFSWKTMPECVRSRFPELSKRSK